MTDPSQNRCPECHNPPGTLHLEACSRVHYDDFVGVPRTATGPAVIHLFPENAQTATCCGIKLWAVPHSQQSTNDPRWATCEADTE
jgi:hypothetical protein